MMLDPGCTAGSRSSPSPQRGPDPSQRMSFAIFVSATAYVAQRAAQEARPHRAPPAPRSDSRASTNGRPVRRAISAIVRRRESRRRIQARADRRPAERQFVNAAERRLDPLAPTLPPAARTR